MAPRDVHRDRDRRQRRIRADCTSGAPIETCAGGHSNTRRTGALFLVAWVILISGGVWVSAVLLVLFPIALQLGFVFIGGQADGSSTCDR